MLLAVAGCSPVQQGDPTDVPATNAPAETAAPAAILPDIPENRYDATVTPRTGANASTPFVNSDELFDGKFSPFFSTSGADTNAVEYTQLELLTDDIDGAMVAGIDYPSLAYAYSQEVSDDKSTSTYNIVLKNGITFSDGMPVTVKDVLFSMYTRCDPLYDGSSTFYTLKIQGLNEYRTQSSPEQIAIAEAITAAGISKAEDGSMVLPPVEGATADQQTAFWNHLDEGGAMFCQSIVDYMMANLLNDGNVQSFLSADLTAADVRADPELQVAFSMAGWGFGTSYDKATNTFVDSTGTEYVLGTGTLTTASFWTAILAKYGYDISDAGINYESADGRRIEEYVRDLYLANEGKAEGGVNSISGITSGKMVCDDGVERDYIQVVCNGVDPTAVFQFNIYISPWHYYTEGFTGEMNEFGVSVNNPDFIRCLKDKNGVPLGAGPYIFEEYKDNIIYYTANDSYLLGSPKIQTMRVMGLTLGAEMDSTLTGTVHYSEPSASTVVINDITNGQGDYAKLGYILVDRDGYGYIGINAQAVPEWNVRKAMAHAMNVQLTIDDFYGELATANYRTMTKVNWAYPENPECMFPYDGTGETSKALFLEAGYIYDEAANIMYYPEGHEKAGQQVTFKATLPTGASDHPAGTVFVDFQKVLASIGVKIDIEVDENILDKLNTAYESGIQLWTAAWGSGGVDPDMFQIWYSDPALNQSTSPVASGLYWLYENGDAEQTALLKKLNELIIAARSTLDIEERKVIYAEALELSTAIATEIPTYQRKEMFVYDKQIINSSTLFSGENVTPFQDPIHYIWNVELNG
jgi:peptide/nickel transport system substrate-binding protein